jgi:hypothetical protein
MRGLIAVAGVLCVAVLVAPAWSGATTATTTAVGVSEREWSVGLGRLKAPHGRIELYVHNFGRDDHNLAVRRLGVQYGFTGRIASGGQKTLVLAQAGRLRPVLFAARPPPAGHGREADRDLSDNPRRDRE